MSNKKLFRGYSEEEKQWVTGYLAGENVICVGKLGCNKDGLYYPENWCPVITESVCQSTGLSAAKSYRGKKPEAKLIFEQDCLEWKRTEAKKSEKLQGVVEWYSDAYIVRLPDNSYWQLSAVCERLCEIIGTKHDGVKY